MFKDNDHKESKNPNRLRREEGMNTLKSALYDPQKVFSLGGSIERFGRYLNYVCIYTRIPTAGCDYEIEEVAENFYDERDRKHLFCSEVHCVKDWNGLDMDSPIPVINLDSRYFIECTVIDLKSLPEEDREIAKRNFVIAQTNYECSFA